MAENLQSDPFEINKSILNAAVNKKPIFESFKNLCEKHKNEKIDYVDFEWKYFQFYHGNQDLIIERSPENSSPLTFYDLPMDVLEKVVGKLNLVDCLLLRKVSHDLRNLVDNAEIQCEKVSLFFQGSSSKFQVDDFSLFYEANDDGTCQVTSRRSSAQNEKKYEEDRDHRELITAVASAVLKNPKLKLGEFWLGVSYNASCHELLEFLNSLDFQLDVRSVGIYKIDQCIMPVLQVLQPKTLESITMSAGELLLHEISKMEQWKKAKNLVWHFCNQDYQMECLLHFKEISLCPFEFTDENLIMVRDVLLKSAHLQWCDLWSYLLRLDDEEEDVVQKTSRIMSQDPSYDPETRRFWIPNSREYFQIELSTVDSSDSLTIKRVSEN